MPSTTNIGVEYRLATKDDIYRIQWKSIDEEKWQDWQYACPWIPVTWSTCFKWVANWKIARLRRKEAKLRNKTAISRPTPIAAEIVDF